ncbi:nucleotide exchange factor GrpE [Holosporaceae bacterium 'Namur']|nr:nucleotide exchange factor GrpE [Holosporaceae bacterium 'Namur']
MSIMHDENNTGELNKTPENTQIQAQEQNENPEENSVENSLMEVSKKLEEEIKSLKELILREKAENQNLRKRHEKELEDNHKYAISNFARDLIEVQENMHRAIDNIPQNEIENNPTLKALLEGVELTKNSLAGIFEKYGIIRIYPLEQQFDHNFHQAIVQVPDAQKPEGSIVQVIQAGYIIKDRLLRPALVAVAKSSS